MAKHCAAARTTDAMLKRCPLPPAPGIAAQNGILIKSAEALQQMSALGAVVFDKTGTLTEGRPSVVGCELLDPQVGDGGLRLTGASVAMGGGRC
jgi:cation transport ATPase